MRDLGQRLGWLTRSLSARLLIWTVVFVMLAEVMIFTPSIARFRHDYLNERLASAHLAILALEATPEKMVSKDLERELLGHVPAELVAVRLPGSGRKLMLAIEMPGSVDASYDLREAGPFTLIRDAFMTYAQREDRLLRVLGSSPKNRAAYVEVLIPEAPLRQAMIDFGYRILLLSLMISLFTAALVYITLHLSMVRPMQRLTDSMITFAENPEDASRVITPSGRQDEIGLAEHHLQEMQEGLRSSLHQKTRLAALGDAVTRINHDLRNILATAQLVSDRLADSADPEVRKNAPTVLSALDRAVRLCAQTLNFTKEGPASLELSNFCLKELFTEVCQDLPARLDGKGQFHCDIQGSSKIIADREQLYRVLHNLGVNALQAGATLLTLSLKKSAEEVVITLEDNGPGLSPRAKEKLFQPFSGTSKPGGTGLGLAIVRELLHGHGGEIYLLKSDAEGTAFRMSLPILHLRKKDKAA